MAVSNPRSPRHRGAGDNPDNRYQELQRRAVDDGWGSLEEEPASLITELTIDSSRTLISYNQSPDVPFDRSINPYRGCEHGCVYCFARPTHAWLGLSPGLDFESRLAYKPEAAAILRRELNARSYRCEPLMLGINTDAYQPVEKRLRITRSILEVLAEANHPLAIVTKSALIERDIDILAPMAERGLVHVAVSVTTLDRDLSRRLEPRTAVPERRLKTIERLVGAGIPTLALAAPLIPMLNDQELEAILKRVHAAGAASAGYILLRLPLEVAGLFESWLEEHEPLKAQRILARIRDSRGGGLYDNRFGKRMRGEGPFADLIAQRYRLAMKRLAFPGVEALDCSQFRPPHDGGPQMALF